jgi:hypothetical protein
VSFIDNQTDNGIRGTISASPKEEEDNERGFFVQGRQETETKRERNRVISFLSV